jgi:poly(ADP-ribose) glycohydrolase ARH3
MPVNPKEKFVGSMIASALGDAIGELAFARPQKDQLMPILQAIAELRYTDDTAMAIGLAESLIGAKGFDSEHLGRTFRENYLREPWRGYASGPPMVFSLVAQRGCTFAQAAKTLFGGAGSLGNGAAMRIGPLGLFYHDSEDLYANACGSAQVTHAHPVGMDGAAVQALAVAQAASLDSGTDFQAERFVRNLVSFARTREIRSKISLAWEAVCEDVSDKEAARLLGQSVAVHESMPFAIFCFLRYHKSFEECVFCAILNGGDRDTLGAMAGAISGAYLGLGCLPQSWYLKLENRVRIAELGAKLHELSLARK